MAGGSGVLKLLITKLIFWVGPHGQPPPPHHRLQRTFSSSSPLSNSSHDHHEVLDAIVVTLLVHLFPWKEKWLLIFHSTFTWKHWVGLIWTSAAYMIPYQQLAQMAKPSYADDGELLDGGFDMSTGGICGYLHDIIYITSFVQLMSIISEKFWYVYLVIPAFGAYKSFGFIRGFLPHGSEGEVEDEKTRKKREKMEKKSARPKFVKTRTR